MRRIRIRAPTTARPSPFGPRSPTPTPRPSWSRRCWPPTTDEEYDPDYPDVIVIDDEDYDDLAVWQETG
jgi:hypothetical protein